MAGQPERRTPISSGWHEAPEHRRSRLAVTAAVGIRLGLLALVVVAVVGILTPATFRTPLGSLSLRLEPAWPGGRLVMPLGPAGEFALRTHRTPVDVVMDYRLPSGAAAVTAGGAVIEDPPALEENARAAFARFLVGRVPWVLLGGAAAGALVAGSLRRRRLVIGAAAGALAAAAFAGGLVAVT